jgi:hypothetical protein
MAAREKVSDLMDEVTLFYHNYLNYIHFEVEDEVQRDSVASLSLLLRHIEIWCKSFETFRDLQNISRIVHQCSSAVLTTSVSIQL